MMKKLLFILIATIFTAFSNAQTVTITESNGWLESAFIKWQPVTGVDSYNVYYSGEGISNKKIDTQLIRSYGTYFRADILGLKAGSYTFKVAPVISGAEGTATGTAAVTVLAHDRTGFCFANGRIPGAYKADGTPKDNAVIIYITEKTKNTVSMDVTGANANPCVGLQTILDGFKKGKDLRPLIVRMVGQITDLSTMYNGDIVIENNNIAASFITLEGVGDDAVADGWGIRIKSASNIELRNFGSMNCDSSEGDNIGLQQDNEYIWVHHIDLFYGNAGSDADQIKGDGAMDCKRSTYVTFSYNHFWDTGKSNLLGLSESSTDGLFITYHHNWYDHSDSRHPRVRYYSAHVYNNYYDGIAKYGVGSTLGSSVFVEGNYFRNCKYPMLISMQGSDVWSSSTQANDYSDMPTFSKEDGGIIKAFNNYMTGQSRFVPYGATGYPISTTVDFDAYVTTTRNETIGSTVVSNYGKNSYNNFDTNAAVMYIYTPDSPEAARDKVMQYSGRVTGGDLKWTFNNAVDDISYAVNTGLKSALINYKTKLVAVQGDGAGDDPGDPGDPAGGLVHNFTLSGKVSSFYTITGNLSDSKGTVTYGGLTLTQCLKMESSTLVSFTTTKEAVLTLVFNSEFSGKINLNGVSYNAVGGIVTLNIPAGSYQITKGDTSNLFYVSVAYPTSGINNPAINVSMYPNPVNNLLMFDTALKILKAEVYCLTGSLVHKTTDINNSIDMSNLQAGSYLVRVFTDEGVINKMIQKK